MNRRRVILIFYYLVFTLIFTGTFGYVIANVFGLDIPAFEIAVVAALLGGFLLANRFTENTNQNQRTNTRRIGLLYFISAISFVLFELYSPIFNIATPDQIGYGFVIAVVVVLITVAMVVFSIATAWILIILPRLW